MLKCDGPGCSEQVDPEAFGAPTYHQLWLGGSDFEMSFSTQRRYDFCSLECLRRFIDECLKDEN